MSRRLLQGLVFAAGLWVGGRGCLPVVERCEKLTLSEVPTGEFVIDESWPDGTSGTLVIDEDRVELDLLHPSFGPVRATYVRSGTLDIME